MFYDKIMKDFRELWPGGPLYRGDGVSGDSLALADFATSVPGERVCDLGCGSGILLLLLAWQRPELTLYGVELRPAAAEECRRNAAANGLSERIAVADGDLRAAPFPAGSMDLVIANPPYFPRGRGAVSPDSDRAAMRTESATVWELCAAAATLLRPEGTFALVHRTERMAEVFAALAAAGLEPKRLRLMAGDPGAAPELFLCEARLHAAPGLVTEPVLYQRRPDGAETEEYRKICHWEA